MPRVCFTADHGERDAADTGPAGASTLAGSLRYLGYEIKPMSLAAPGAEAELRRCAAVVVAGARVPFLATELELLGAHARNNGRLLLLADAAAAPVRDQLNELLSPWGVGMGAGIVRDVSALADDPSSIAAHDFGAGGSPPVRRLQQQNIPVVLTNALAVDGHRAEEHDAFIELVRSSKKSWIADDSDTRRMERQGPFVLAALADWSRIEGGEDHPSIARTRIGVLGSAEMATNRMIDMFGNRQFLTALVQWTAGEDDLIAAGRPPLGFDKVLLTADQKDRLTRQGIVLPALVVLLPLPWAIMRLRRG